MGDIANRAELEKKLARELGKLQHVQLVRLLEELGDPPRIENVTPAFWDSVGKELAKTLAPFLENVYLQQAQELMMSQPVGVDWALVNQGAVDWASRYTFELVRGINQTSQQALRRAVAAYFERGQTIGDLQKAIVGIFGPVRAENIAVTEVTRAAAQGEYQISKDLRKEGVNMVPFWQTSEDEIVCPICRPLNDRKADGLDVDGNPYWVHPKNGKQYQHPAHPRCRCFPRHQLPRP